jgi:hypothetical protein
LRWTAFVPLPEVLLADVDLAEGRVREAAGGYEHAHALAVQLGDPCWEGYAMRGLGMLAARTGELDSAVQLVSAARTRCVRLPDAHQWVEGYCLDALCAIAVEQELPQAAQWSRDLASLAARYGMRELVARAYRHLARLGDPSAAEAARVLAAEVDNPALRVSAPGAPRPAARP